MSFLVPIKNEFNIHNATNSVFATINNSIVWKKIKEKITKIVYNNMLKCTKMYISLIFSQSEPNLSPD